MFLDLNSNHLKENSIAINYLWNHTTHLLRAGIDSERNLYILEYLTYPPKTLPETIIKKVNSHKKHKIYTNIFQPLKEQLGGKCRQFSEDLVINLDTYYEILRESERIFLIEDIVLPQNDTDFILCAAFLLKGLLPKLCNSRKGSINFSSINNLNAPSAYSDFLNL